MSNQLPKHWLNEFGEIIIDPEYGSFRGSYGVLTGDLLGSVDGPYDDTIFRFMKCRMLREDMRRLSDE